MRWRQECAKVGRLTAGAACGWSRASTVRAGQTIAGKYRVEELLGSGASGVVLSARSIHLRERVALKILASYTDGQEELLRRRVEKARLAARLQRRARRAHRRHRRDRGRDAVRRDGVARGHDARGRARRARAAPRRRGRALGARGLRGARRGPRGRARPRRPQAPEPLARRAEEARRAATHAEDDARLPRSTRASSRSSTSARRARSTRSAIRAPRRSSARRPSSRPSRSRRREAVDARADVWALGVLLYNLVSGALPFEADTLSGVIVAVVYDAPALLTDAPYELARLVHRCLDKDPAKRPQDVAELAAALAPFAGSSGARLAERVRAMLEAPRRASPTPHGRRRPPSGSLPPVSMPVGAADPLRRRSADEAETTQPSRRVIAQRRAREPRTAVTLVGARVAIAMASWATILVARRRERCAGVPRSPRHPPGGRAAGRTTAAPSPAAPAPTCAGRCAGDDADTDGAGRRRPPAPADASRSLRRRPRR